MRKFHKSSLSTSGRHSSRQSCEKSRNSASRYNSTNATILKAVKCTMCQQSTHLHSIITARFRRQHNQSERFLYTKDVDDLLNQRKTPKVILTKDVQQLVLEQQNLKNFKPIYQYRQRLIKLAEYFKYYKDLPRYQMKTESEIVRKHYEMHRLLEYNRLKNVLNFEGDPLLTEKSSVDVKWARRKTLQNESYSNILKYVLDTKRQESRQSSRPSYKPEESLMLLKHQLSQLLGKINLQKQIEPKITDLTKKRRLSMPDCSSISEIVQNKDDTLRTFRLPSKKEAKPILCTFNDKSVLKTAQSPSKCTIMLKKARKYRSQCSMDQQGLKRYKLSMQNLPTNLKPDFKRPHNKRETCRMLSKNTSNSNIRQITSGSKRSNSIIKFQTQNLKNMTETQLKTKKPNTKDNTHMLIKELQKNPIKIAIRNSNCVNIIFDPRHGCCSTAFKKKTIRM